MRHAWIDASAGVAGDMLLAALHDAGAGLDVIRSAVEAVVPGSVEIGVRGVSRAGLRALKAEVRPLTDDPPHRTWRGIREMLSAADLRPGVRARAVAVFGRLAEAEAVVHGVAAEDVHFHEVGALDSLADVVGVCAALDDLGVGTVSAGEVAVGSGRVRTAHGELPVPAPAVAELSRGWRIRSGGAGELATPTGMAVIRALSERCEDLPAMTLEATGVGAGGRDTPGRPNVVRIFLGSRQSVASTRPAVLLEANVDDMDPRLWPGVIEGLMAAGASDAWLVPILMKKGRPAHTLSVLCEPSAVAALRTLIFRDTSTLGVRESPRAKTALPRLFVPVETGGVGVPVKIGHLDGMIVQVMPEFADVAALAARQGRPERAVMHEALAAAAAGGLVVGAPLPDELRSETTPSPAPGPRPDGSAGA
ncbi:nickel pincer cofactor biosynthesis protein LarC [Actinoplanes sp. CA-131856]